MLGCFRCERRRRSKKPRFDQQAKPKPVWVTPKPRNKAAATILFLGLDSSGKTSVVNSLLDLQAPNTGRHNLPIAPAPTVDVVYSTINSMATEFVAVDVPGALSQRAVWREQLQSADGVVFVVDSMDELRSPVMSAELMRAMPYLTRKGIPLLVLATKQDLPGHKPIEELLWSVNLPRICASLPAPWNLKGVTVLEPQAVRNALWWLLTTALEMRSLQPDALKERRAECQAANAEYAASAALPYGQDELN